MEVIPLTGAGNPLGPLRAALKRGRLVCLLADRDLTGSGVEVDLLGEPARLPGGPAALARMTGAPLVAASLTLPRAAAHGSTSATRCRRCSGSGGVAAMTQQVADWFTDGIRREPGGLAHAAAGVHAPTWRRAAG